MEDNVPRIRALWYAVAVALLRELAVCAQCRRSFRSRRFRASQAGQICVLPKAAYEADLAELACLSVLTFSAAINT